MQRRLVRLSVSVIIIGGIISDRLMLNRASVPRGVPVTQSTGTSFRFGIDRKLLVPVIE